MHSFGRLHIAICAALFGAISSFAADSKGAARFKSEVQPILKQYCYDCHADGANKGGVSFDEFKSDETLLGDHDLWFRALKNVRAGIMPPPKKPQPGVEDKRALEGWIKSAVFQVDPNNLDPGRVTVRRLNRVEYRNTIRDLMGIDFDTQTEFPPDDSGRGFDNIADALTLSPMLLEKYLAAARVIVTKGVPPNAGVPAEHLLSGRNFKGAPKTTNVVGGSFGNALALSYYEPATISNRFNVETAGKYQVALEFSAVEKFVDNQFDQNKCRLIFKVDGKELHKADYTREGGRQFKYEFDQDWTAGEHHFVLELTPLTPDEKQIRLLTIRLEGVNIRGPLAKEFYVKPKNYARFFGEGKGKLDDKSFARRVLTDFATKAYRRPVEKDTVERLVKLAESVYSQKGKTIEEGIQQGMVAVMASPRFLFREEGFVPAKDKFAMVDEYALASRLSYFLWSSMPDDELTRLAAKGELRKNLAAQQKRMLADEKSQAFIRNFVGQWLQTRDIETIQIDARGVLARESAGGGGFGGGQGGDRPRFNRPRMNELIEKEDSKKISDEEKVELAKLRKDFDEFRKRQQAQGFFRGPRADLTGDIRRAMRQETERAVDYVIREDRSLVELLDCDYTFLNEKLATHYGLTNLNVHGDEMRLVKLPADSPRGGVITHGSVLAVTSNPTRTSPVKRGLFILDNLLGTPPPPPPPDIPPLEDALKAAKGKKLTLRETLALHREQALCASCHNRMDPLGLALDNFNAMGMWREKDLDLPIDPSGKLLSGETFADVRELKKTLAKNHSGEFYQTVAEKMLTYALGRGLEYYDVATVDAIVDDLKKADGRPSALLTAIINSAPFQKTRISTEMSAAKTGKSEARN
jgi:hypothetical protein